MVSMTGIAVCMVSGGCCSRISSTLRCWGLKRVSGWISLAFGTTVSRGVLTVSCLWRMTFRVVAWVRIIRRRIRLCRCRVLPMARGRLRRSLFRCCCVRRLCRNWKLLESRVFFSLAPVDGFWSDWGLGRGVRFLGLAVRAVPECQVRTLAVGVGAGLPGSCVSGRSHCRVAAAWLSGLRE